MATEAAAIQGRTISRKRQFALNAASGFVAQTVTAGVGFVTLPYLLWRLGPEVYGISLLAQSALVFFSFLQLGMGPTLTRYCSQAIARNDQDAVRKISSTAQLILSVLGFVGMLGVIGGIPFFIWFYGHEIPSGLTFDVGGLLLCMAVSLFLNFVFFVPSGLLLGSNRYDLANGVEIVACLLRLGLIVTTFELFGPSLLLFGISVLMAHLFRFVAFITLAFKKVGRAVLFSMKSVSRETLRSLLGFSVLNLINSISCSLVIQGPVLIIGKVLGAEAVTMFAPAVLIATSIQGFLGQISRPLVPLASQAQAENNRKKMGDWAIMIGSLIACVGLAAVLPLVVFGKELVGLWLGEAMSPIWVLVAIMTLGTVLSQVGTAKYFLALGGGSIRPIVYSQIVLGITCFTCTALGTRLFGWRLVHVALFIVLCQCLRNIFYLVYAYSKQFDYSISRYWWIVFVKPLVVFLGFAVIGYLLKLVFVPDAFVVLCTEIMVVLFMYGVAAWLFLIDSRIKSAFLSNMSIRQGV